MGNLPLVARTHGLKIFQPPHGGCLFLTMATFVDVATDEEQIEALVQYVSGLHQKKNPDQEVKLEAECNKLIQEGASHDTILTKLVGEHEAIFSDQNDKGL